MLAEKRTLVKIAHYYYKQKLTQSEIAKRLGISRQRVNRLAQKLEEEGIVEIKINGYEGLYTDLENQLENIYGLKQVVIAPNIDGEDPIEQLGMAGAKYIGDIVDHSSTIGVSWGRTLYSVAKHIPPHRHKNVSVVQLVGGLNQEDTFMTSNEITRLMAKNLGGTPYFMYAPAIVESEEIKEVFMADQSIKNVFERMSQCDIALVGIGEVSKEATLYTQDYIRKEDLEGLIGLGALGDICSRYYDRDGKIITNSYTPKVVGIDVDMLKRIPLVVGVAAGEGKIDAIVGALKGKHLDVLITNIFTAERLMKDRPSAQ